MPIWARWNWARFCSADIVAITGTNGKSTTTEMIAHLARKAGRRAEALGNLGIPLSQVVDDLPIPKRWSPWKFPVFSSKPSTLFIPGWGWF